MTINLVLQQEYQHKKLIAKRARRNIAISLIACTLVFVAQLAVSFIYALLHDVIPINTDISVLYLLDIISYVFYICVPFAIALLFFNLFSYERYTFVKRASPKKPLLFVAGTLGCSYIVNLVAMFIFPSLADFGETTSIIAKSPLEIALCFVLYAILPAILEEWAFRGILLKNLLPYGKWGAIIISSLLFGLGHIHPKSIINALTFGIILGICYEYTGSLKLSMLIHFLNNGISVVASLLPEDSPWIVLVSLLIYVFMGCGVGAIIYYANKGYKRNNFTLIKPYSLGYCLSVQQYFKQFILNFAIVPYAVIFITYFYLAFYF